MGEDKDGAPIGAIQRTIVAGPWSRFWTLVSEPWTVLLLLASISLFVIGQQKLSPSVTALVQILLAVASGVLGARVTNLLEAASSKNILEARGRVAVRGLKLMLVQTSAFQRRVQKFLENRVHIEREPEVTARNYEEAVEFCRRIQEEAASAMENWADVVPSADLSSLIGRITEAEEDHEATKAELSAAKELMTSFEQRSENAVQMQGVIETLEKQLLVKESRIDRLTKKLSRVGVDDPPPGYTYSGWSNELVKLAYQSESREKDTALSISEWMRRRTSGVDLDSDEKK